MYLYSKLVVKAPYSVLGPGDALATHGSALAVTYQNLSYNILSVFFSHSQKDCTEKLCVYIHFVRPVISTPFLPPGL